MLELLVRLALMIPGVAGRLAFSLALLADIAGCNFVDAVIFEGPLDECLPLLYQVLEALDFGRIAAQ